MERNKSRHRQVEEPVIPYHNGLLQQTLKNAPVERVGNNVGVESVVRVTVFVETPVLPLMLFFPALV